MENDEAHTSWNGLIIFLSFILSFIGSHSTVCLAEQHRIAMSLKPKFVSRSMYLVMMSISLGGGAIWSMHFIGISAMKLHDSDGKVIPIEFDLFATLMSLVACIVCVFVGLYISSRDKMFCREKDEILQLIVAEGQRDHHLATKGKRYLMRVALLRGTGPLVVGGVISGGGICVMHYLGMYAMHGDVKIQWNGGIVFSSILIAIFAATASFWILFRLLALFPTQEKLRFLSSLVAACAVCGMHYTGMEAATFIVDHNTASPTFWYHLDQITANILALTFAVLISWLSSTAVQADLRNWHAYLFERLKAARKVLDQLHERYESDMVLHNYSLINAKVTSSCEEVAQEPVTAVRPFNLKSDAMVVPEEEVKRETRGLERERAREGEEQSTVTDKY